MTNKVAFCFLISYKHEINKEHIWIKWLKEIEDIVNVYIHYTDYSQIKSSWIRERVLPQKCIVNTNYTHVVPAYMSLMNYASKIDTNNQWFCFVTESCCPIIPAKDFRRIFLKKNKKSIMKHKPIWWNPYFINRANLSYLEPRYHLSNNPWFILSRKSVELCLLYININFEIYDLICRGPIANESIFAIMLYSQNALTSANVINKDVFATDWNNMDSPTSPHTFHIGNPSELKFIEEKTQDKYVMFLRKVSSDFPDDILEKYISICNSYDDNNKIIYEKDEDQDEDKNIDYEKYYYKTIMYLFIGCIMLYCGLSFSIFMYIIVSKIRI
jgi:hypothetical protein